MEQREQDLHDLMPRMFSTLGNPDDVSVSLRELQEYRVATCRQISNQPYVISKRRDRVGRPRIGSGRTCRARDIVFPTIDKETPVYGQEVQHEFAAECSAQVDAASVEQPIEMVPDMYSEVALVERHSCKIEAEHARRSSRNKHRRRGTGRKAEPRMFGLEMNGTEAKLTGWEEEVLIEEEEEPLPLMSQMTGLIGMANNELAPASLPAPCKGHNPQTVGAGEPGESRDEEAVSEQNSCRETRSDNVDMAESDQDTFQPSISGKAVQNHMGSPEGALPRVGDSPEQLGPSSLPCPQSMTGGVTQEDPVKNLLGLSPGRVFMPRQGMASVSTSITPDPFLQAGTKTAQSTPLLQATADPARPAMHQEQEPVGAPPEPYSASHGSSHCGVLLPPATLNLRPTGAVPLSVASPHTQSFNDQHFVMTMPPSCHKEAVAEAVMELPTGRLGEKQQVTPETASVWATPVTAAPQTSHECQQPSARCGQASPPGLLGMSQPEAAGGSAPLYTPVPVLITPEAPPAPCPEGAPQLEEPQGNAESDDDGGGGGDYDCGASDHSLCDDDEGARVQEADTQHDNQAGPSGVAQSGPKKSRMAREEKASRQSLAGAGTLWTGNVRRSTRMRFRPLEYWRNERVIYGRQHKSLPTVMQVETHTPDASWPLPSGRKKKRAMLSQKPVTPVKVVLDTR